VTSGHRAGARVVKLSADGRKAEQAWFINRLDNCHGGVVLLDGTWSQAKALWWRNPWVLKCQRIVLNPRQPSRYGAIRREPRRDSLSTLEAAGLVLSRLEGKPDIETELAQSFERLLAELRPALRPSRARRGPPRRSHGGRR
jgi:hypothetical protein